MSLQQTGSGPSPAEISAAQQQSQAGPSYGGGGGGSARRPRREDLSNEANDLLDLREKTDELLGENYKDKEAARERLSHLSEEQVEKLKTDPTVLGELRPGVDPESVETDKLAVTGQSFWNVKSQARQEVASYESGQMAYDSRKEQERESGIAKSPEARANESLNGAMSISHHASI